MSKHASAGSLLSAAALRCIGVAPRTVADSWLLGMMRRITSGRRLGR
jgi:hypothetical protein